MGMAASQVRLLALTSRLHDVEFEAQSLQSQKIALATQKDALYQDYCDALDAKKIQVAYMDGMGEYNYVDASFATLCGYNSNRVTEYTLIDSRTDKVIVDQETYDIYNEFYQDKYTFALAMMGFTLDYEDQYEYGDPDKGPRCLGYYNDNLKDPVLMTGAEEVAFYETIAKGGDKADALQEAYDKWEEAKDDDSLSDKEKAEAYNAFRDALYDSENGIADVIYNYMRLSFGSGSEEDVYDAKLRGDYDPNFDEKLDIEEFNYYVALFENIQAHGGCTPIDPACESGDEGETWFNNMVNAGLVLIEVYDREDEEWTQTSVATSSTGNYLKETQDETDLKKAEAEYEHELDKINDKDTQFDNKLNELETERTAITTEIESIQKVRDDNIERTFGIFS